MSGVFWITGARGVWLAVLITAFVVTLGCSIAWLVMEMSGARAAFIGSVGESRSADSLKGLSKRWTRVDSVPFGKNFDIDHVLISDAGVFAVETKFTASEWSLSSPALRNAIRRRWKARKIKFLLDRAGHPPVTAVLIIWGPGAPTIPTGFEVDDRVRGVPGSSAKEWRAYLEGLEPTIDPASVPTLVNIVRDPTDEHRTSPPSDLGRPLTDELLAVSTRREY